MARWKAAPGRRRELRGTALATLPLDKCSVCCRGREACQYCDGLSTDGWLDTCSCGLSANGRHTVSCEGRGRYRYVVWADPAGAVMPRSKK